jgi:hypothetical protein
MLVSFKFYDLGRWNNFSYYYHLVYVLVSLCNFHTILNCTHKLVTIAECLNSNKTIRSKNWSFYLSIYSHNYWFLCQRRSKKSNSPSISLMVITYCPLKLIDIMKICVIFKFIYIWSNWYVGWEPYYHILTL